MVTVLMAMMVAAFCVDMGPLDLMIIIGGLAAVALFVFAPGGPVSSTVSIEGPLVVGEGVFHRRIIAISNLAAVEVSGTLMRRVRLYARDASTVIECDLRMGQSEELLHTLASRAPTEIASPRRPKSAYVNDMFSIVIAAVLVVLTGWTIRPVGFFIGLAIACAWTLLGWARLRSVRAALASGRTPASLGDWCRALGVGASLP